MDVLLHKAEDMLAADLNFIGQKHASQIWGFISKFVMLDRFIKTLGEADGYPGLLVQCIEGYASLII